MDRTLIERQVVIDGEELISDGGPVSTLHQLIRARMEERGWSYTELARRSHHELTRGRWQQLGSGARQKNFPDPASLLVIAQVLELDITTVVLAAAQAVGLDVRRDSSDLAQLLPPGTQLLSERTRDALLALIRAMVADAAGDGAADPGGLTGLRLEWPKANAPSRQHDVGQDSHNGPTEAGHIDAR